MQTIWSLLSITHIWGILLPCFRHQTGAPLSVTKACGNLKQLHISHFTPFYPPLSHNSPGQLKGGAEQVHCTWKARTKGRPITERGDLGPEDDGTWSMSPWNVCYCYQGQNKYVVMGITDLTPRWNAVGRTCLTDNR